jgi:hypothetical protein
MCELLKQCAGFLRIDMVNDGNCAVSGRVAFVTMGDAIHAEEQLQNMLFLGRKMR